MNREITIGNADGLREANRPDFKELFYSDSRHYRDLKSDDCFVVLGSKGAGKTVLLKYFQIMNHSPKQLTLVNYFEFGEIKTDELIEFSFNNIDLEVRSHFQKYYLLKSAFSTINKFTKEIGIFNFIGEYGPVKGIINYRKYSRLVKEICSLDFMPKLEEVIRQEVEYNSSIGNSVSYKMDANLSGVSAGVGAGVTEEKTSKYNRVNYYTNFDYYKTLLEEVSAYLTIILLFDDLEEAPINLKTPEISYIADFIENIYRFNLELNNYNRKSRAVVAVREDLLKRMITSNSNISKKQRIHQLN